MSNGRTRTIKVDALARVEGEGGMLVRVRNGVVSDVELQIYEPPRFFEAFLRGRSFREAPDITSRICGICPIAYQMSACQAMEDALGVTVDGQLRALRRLIYCGEWIESHLLHIYLLHAPDFLGYAGAIEMARDHREIVERGLQMKKIGNELIDAVGGRAVHPINLRVGGFYRAPSRAELRGLLDKLEWAREAALETVRWTAGFDFPDFESDYEFVSLRHPDEYPIHEGRLVSDKGLDIAVREFNDHFEELHVRHSTALHARLRERGSYFCGPLARYNLNYDRLSPGAKEAARAAGLGPVVRNPFQSIVVRSVEVLYAYEEAIRLISQYDPPDQPAVAFEPHAGVGHGCTEAPRGILYHRYELADDGAIVSAQIVPPTSQNQATVEEDLHRFVQPRLELSRDELTKRCEQAIRNYDPCISCSTHFLDLRIEREDDA
jgi:coenzyme F420-reducing hydrogenase alpha subunit